MIDTFPHSTDTPAEHEATRHFSTYEELMVLDDEELLAVSRDFGAYYTDLLKRGVSPEIDDAVYELGLAPAGSDAQEVVTNTIVAARAAAEKYHGTSRDSAVPSAFEGEVEIGVFGIPIVKAKASQIERAFGKRQAISFCASDYMIEQGRLPVVFTSEREGARQDEAVRHELSHAAYGMLRHAEVVPGGTQTYRGIEAVTLMAKDEAIAQMAAGQKKVTHPVVVRALRNMYGDDAEIVHRYRDQLVANFSQQSLAGTGLELRDGILLAMTTTSLDELIEGLSRLGTIARAHRDHLPSEPEKVEEDYESVGWGAI